MKEYVVLYKDKYAIIPEDYAKGKLEGFPIEVVAQMAIETMKQGNIFDVKKIQQYIMLGKTNGGFNWSESEDSFVIRKININWRMILASPKDYVKFIKSLEEVNIHTLFKGGVIYQLPNKEYFVSIDDIKEINNGIDIIWKIMYLYYKYEVTINHENLKEHREILSKLNVSYEDKKIIDVITNSKFDITSTDNILHGVINKDTNSFIIKTTSENNENTFIKRSIYTNNKLNFNEDTIIVKDYVYKTEINEQYAEIFLTKEEIDESIRCNISPIITLMAKHNAIRQNKKFQIKDIELMFISSFRFDGSVERAEFWCEVKSKFKKNYFNIGHKFFTPKGKILKIKNVIIEGFKNNDYIVYIKFDNGTVINSNGADKYLDYTNKWYKEEIIKDSDYKISADIYKKFYEYPISLVRSFINSLWLSNALKRDNFNSFVLSTMIEDLVEYYCYNKTWFKDRILKHDYESYYINAKKEILEEDLMYFKDVLKFNFEYELPEYFKIKMKHKTGKELLEEKLASIEELNNPKCIKDVEYRLIYPKNKLEISLTEVEKSLCVENNINPYVALLYKANYYSYHKPLWLSAYVLKEVDEILNIKNSLEGEYFWNKVISNNYILGESRAIIYNLGKDEYKLKSSTLYITEKIKSGYFSIHYIYESKNKSITLIESYTNFKKEDIKIINNQLKITKNGNKERNGNGSESELQRESTFESCIRHTERSRIYCGKHGFTNTDAITNRKERVKRKNSVFGKD